MKKYKITYYAEGVKRCKTIEAPNRDAALNIAWAVVASDDLYISEVEE